MIDIIEANRKYPDDRIECLDKGFVRLVDVMPRLAESGDLATGDFSIVQAARVSYGKGTKQVNQDRGLIRYLMRNWHTSPLEMAEVKLHVKMPIFVARQWVRHRTANINEYSGRYSEMSSDFYLPDQDRIQKQSSNNKQGSGESFDAKTSADMVSSMEEGQKIAYEEYTKYMDSDMARELSRINLPVSNYTEWYWKCDLMNLFKFLKLRLDSHAQYEIRVYAEAILNLIEPLFPLACEAFSDYWLNGESFSKQQMEILRDVLKDHQDILDKNDSMDISLREINELKSKLGII